MISTERLEAIDKVIERMQTEPGALVHLDNREYEWVRTWEKVDDLLRQYGNTAKVAKMMLNDSRFGINSKTTAYKYIEETQYVYNTRSKLNVDYWMTVLFEKQFDVFIKAGRLNQFKACNGALANMIKILGYYKQDGAITADQLEQHRFTLLVNVPDKKAMSIDFSKFVLMPAEERISLLDQLDAEELSPDMVTFIENEESGE